MTSQEHLDETIAIKTSIQTTKAVRFRAIDKLVLEPENYGFMTIETGR